MSGSSSSDLSCGPAWGVSYQLIVFNVTLIDIRSTLLSSSQARRRLSRGIGYTGQLPHRHRYSCTLLFSRSAVLRNIYGRKGQVPTQDVRCQGLLGVKRKRVVGWEKPSVQFLVFFYYENVSSSSDTTDAITASVQPLLKTHGSFFFLVFFRDFSEQFGAVSSTSWNPLEF